MVSAVRDTNLAVKVHCYTSGVGKLSNVRPLHRFPSSIDSADSFHVSEILVEYLYAVVSRICDINVSITIDCHVSRSMKLAGVLPFRSNRMCYCPIFREDMYFVLLKVCHHNSIVQVHCDTTRALQMTHANEGAFRKGYGRLCVAKVPGNSPTGQSH